MSQRISYSEDTNLLDVTGAGDVEIMIPHHGEVIWVNEGGRCLLRICAIEGRIVVSDQRSKKLRESSRKLDRRLKRRKPKEDAKMAEAGEEKEAEPVVEETKATEPEAAAPKAEVTSEATPETAPPQAEPSEDPPTT